MRLPEFEEKSQGRKHTTVHLPLLCLQVPDNIFDNTFTGGKMKPCVLEADDPCKKEG